MNKLTKSGKQIILYFLVITLITSVFMQTIIFNYDSQPMNTVDILGGWGVSVFIGFILSQVSALKNVIWQ